MEDVHKTDIEVRNEDIPEKYGIEFKGAEPLTYEQVFQAVNSKGQGEYAMKTIEYCKLVKKDNMNLLVEQLSKKEGLSKLEIVSLCNLLPKTIDQTQAFIPSVEDKTEKDLSDYLKVIEQVADEDDFEDFDF